MIRQICVVNRPRFQEPNQISVGTTQMTDEIEGGVRA